MIDIMRSLAICVHHEILLGRSGTYWSQKTKITINSWLGSLKKERKNYRRQQQYMPVTGIYLYGTAVSIFV
jgi:hypothetical protein